MNANSSTAIGFLDAFDETDELNVILVAEVSFRHF